MAKSRKPARASNASRTPATPAATRVVRRRLWSIAATWIFIVVFLVGPALVGNLLFVVPAVGFAIAAVATMRLARNPEGPDAQVLAPGALKAATRADPVEVNGSWSAGGSVRAGAASRGTLRFADRRISFETDQGEITFDTPVNKVRMAAVPGFWRPQLDLDIADLTHTIRFYPLWDLGATVVGPVVAGEWYAQLRDLGAK
jgi:hypothetical protein